MKLSHPARDLVTLIRRHRLTYRGLSRICHQARRHLGMKEPGRKRQLPKLLSATQLSAFYKAIDQAGNLKHQLMLRLLFYTGIRVAELTQIRVEHVDLDASRIFIDSGKGDKDRYVLFREGFGLTLKAYLETIPENTYLFESNQRKAYTPRMIQYIVSGYAEDAGIRAHPHLLRHQLLTFLTQQGLSDAQIQLISGHASKKSLEVYQHLGLQDVRSDYQEAMKKVEI